MNCLGKLLLMAVCCTAGYVAVNKDPELPGQALAAGATGVGWIAGALSSAGATPHSSPTPVTISPTLPPVATQAPVVAPAPTARPLPLRTPAPTARPTPRPTAAPTPVPTAAPQSWTLPWTRAQLDYAINVLKTDEYDDTQAEQRYPNLAAYYAMWAARWTADLVEIQATGQGAPVAQAPDPGTIATESAQFQQAYQLHLIDEQQYPQNKWWDDMWLAYYTQLTALWSQL